MSKATVNAQVINDSGTQVVDTWAFNAEDMSVSPMLTVHNFMVSVPKVSDTDHDYRS